MAILLATPYMDEAARCHRAGLLYDGRLLEEGSPGDMLRRFTHAVLRVLGERSTIEGVLENDADVLAFTPAGAELRIVVRAGCEEAITRRLREAGAHTSPATPAFEDLFLARVREKNARRQP